MITYRTRGNPTILERLLSEGALRPSECWEYTGARHPDGYGFVKYQGRMWYAHRAAYTLIVGPIPEGKELDHLCRNRACCNPAHLEAVPQCVNWERSQAPSRLRALSSACKYGHEYTVENTRYGKHRGGKIQRVCRECERIKAQTPKMKAYMKEYHRQWYAARKERAA